MRSSDDSNTSDNGGGNQDSGKAVALQAWEPEIGLALNMQRAEATYPSKMMNFMSQYRSSTEIASGDSFKYTAGGETGKSFFTDSQWQEFESQKTIFKHIMASNPVPPQSNRLDTGTGLRFSSGSDPEPWRCRRTDGKKWRCSRDVVPDQKYCERHAHKSRSRPRSRKLVETLAHNTKNDNYHPILPSVPSMATSSQQSRCTEWFMKSGTIPLSSSNQKTQKPTMDSSSVVSSKRDHFRQQNHQDLVSLRSRNDRDDCPLSLSMQPGGDVACKDQDFFQMGNGMLDGDRIGNVDVSNSCSLWANQGSWSGGPLGEALCPRIARTLNGPPNNATSSEDCGRH